ncbi:MAG: NAD(+)/NADH kinase [Candidatus Bathyarchaeia archaeon]
MFKKIGIIARVDRKDAVDVALDLASFLDEKHLDVILDSDLARHANRSGVPLNSIVADMIVTVGGDGTILRAVHGLTHKAPILAVRMGLVGFLADVEPEQAREALDLALEGKATRDYCSTLETNLGLPPALNEVRVGTEVPQEMVGMSVLLDGREISRDRVDALLVSTTTGSSAYALSAGGSVLDSRLEALVVVPVSPLSPNFKPHVVPSNVEVTIRPFTAVDLMVLVDGRFQKRVPPLTEVKVRKSEAGITFLRTRDNFYERLWRRLASSANPT